jgi:hypothetical protein
MSTTLCKWNLFLFIFVVSEDLESFAQQPELRINSYRLELSRRTPKGPK